MCLTYRRLRKAWWIGVHVRPICVAIIFTTKNPGSVKLRTTLLSGEIHHLDISICLGQAPKCLDP